MACMPEHFNTREKQGHLLASQQSPAPEKLIWSQTYLVTGNQTQFLDYMFFCHVCANHTP